MQLVTAAEVQKLTGLTSHQLREWSSRRKLIEPDVVPNGAGTRALYSWQTVLVLRLAATLKKQFHVELKALNGLFKALSAQINKASFPALRNCVFVVMDMETFAIVPAKSINHNDMNGIFIPLNPHLDVLITQFGLAKQSRQRPLFPVAAI